MKQEIVDKYNDLVNTLGNNYNKIKVIDNFDWNEYSPYTIFYLNKNESFDKFNDLWEKVKYEINESDDFSYEDILNDFENKAKEQFDFIELGKLDIYTDSEYELNI